VIAFVRTGRSASGESGDRLQRNTHSDDPTTQNAEKSFLACVVI
jgi:hypothetical protein